MREIKRNQSEEERRQNNPNPFVHENELFYEMIKLMKKIKLTGEQNGYV